MSRPQTDSEIRSESLSIAALLQVLADHLDGTPRPAAEADGICDAAGRLIETMQANRVDSIDCVLTDA